MTEAPAVTEAPAATVEAAATEATAAGTAPPVSGQIVVSTWQIGGGQPSELAQKMLTEAFQKVQPDVDIVWEIQVGGNYGEWLGTQLAAGTPRPDIVSMNYQPTYDKYVDFINYKEETNPYTGRLWSEDFDFEFYGSGATEWKFFATQQVQVPWFYNKTMFDKAGVTAAPTNYDEWMDACDKILTATNVQPLAMHPNNMIQWMAEVYFDQYHRDWVDKAKAQEGDWNYVIGKDDVFVYDANDPDLNKKVTFSMQRFLKGLKDGTLRYDDDEMTDLMTNWKRMAPFLPKDFWVEPNRYALFIQQQAAMYPDLTTAYWTLETDLNQMDAARREALKLDASATIAPFEYDIFQYPSVTSPLVKGKARAVESIAGEYLGLIDKTAEQTAVGVEFMRFWLSKAGYQPWVDGYAESKLWTPSGKLLIRDVTVPEEYAKVIDAIKPVGNAEAPPNGFLTMFGGYGTMWQTESKEMVKAVIDGTLAPADFGKQYHALITEKYWGDILKTMKITQDEVDNPQIEPAG
jgi:ABC-type glycerol-3-phosphate transport system substrate-binding protein